MGIKPTIEMMPQRTLSVPTRGNAVMVSTPPQMVTVPAPLPTPVTIWGARRQARYYDALRDVTNAQSGYLRSRAELAKSFVAAGRAANEVAELPEICESDTQVRRLQRDLKLFSSRAFADEARAAAVRAARRLFDRVWNAMGVCKRSGHTKGDGCTLPRPRHVTDFGRFGGVAWLG